MKINTGKIFYSALIVVLLISCGKIKFEDETNMKYAICLGEFGSYEDAEIFKSKIDFKLWYDLRIKQISDSKFVLLYGKYETSYEAGQKAFDLFNQSLINNYKIFKNDDYVRDQFANVLFVAKYSGRPSVYNFNLFTKQVKPLWSRWGRKVLMINHSKDASNVFITTVSSYKKKSSLPVIKDARLYNYSAAKNQVDEISEFGDGIQIYTFWENDDTFKVNFTFPDSLKPEILIQNIYSFDKEGKLGTVNKRTFNLIKDGFPKPPNLKPVVISPKGRFQMRNIKENGKGYIYLRDLTKNAELLVADYNGIVKNSFWTDDEKFLFIIVAIIKNGKQLSKSELLIIDTEEMKLRRNYYGPINQNLLVHGNFLFFDEQIYDVTQIVVYDLKADSIYYKIQTPGGCGINYLRYD